MIKSIAKKILINFSFREEKYLSAAFSAMPGGGSLVLIDVGAAGDVEPRWKKVEKHLEYFGFEPDIRSLQKIEQMPSQLKRRKLFNYAVWDSAKSIHLNMCANPQVSSYFSPNRNLLDKFPNSQRFDVEHEELLECIPLDDLKITSSDFIKIDVQGGELAVLKGATNTLNKTFGLEVEVEFLRMYEGQPLFGEICDYLESFGFELVDFTNICRWERRSYNGFGQSVFGDALFLKTPEHMLQKHRNIESLSAYFKILLLYRRFDLVYVLLDSLSVDERGMFNIFEKQINPIRRSFNRARMISVFCGRLMRIFGVNYRSHLIY